MKGTGFVILFLFTFLMNLILGKRSLFLVLHINFHYSRASVEYIDFKHLEIIEKDKIKRICFLLHGFSLDCSLGSASYANFY